MSVCPDLSFLTCHIISNFICTVFPCWLFGHSGLLVRQTGLTLSLLQNLCGWSTVLPGIHLACSFPSFRPLPEYDNEASLTTHPSTHDLLAPSISSCIWVVSCFLPSPRLEGSFSSLFCSLLCLPPVPRTASGGQFVSFILFLVLSSFSA